MGVFANKPWVKLSAWACTAAIVAANAWLIQQSLADWVKDARGTRRLSGWSPGR